MSTKKKRKATRKKKSRFSIWMQLLAACVLCVLLFWLDFVAFNASENRSRPFPYEEIYSSSRDLNESIKQIDYCLYDAFYRGGVHEKDVLFLDVHPLHRNGHVWDYARILIRCPDRHIFASLQRIIKQKLAVLGKNVRVKEKKGPKGEITYHIYAKSFETHKLVLSMNGYKPPVLSSPPRIAIIVDDLGYDSLTDEAFLNLDLNLSYSVLPHGPCTESIVQRINETNRELLLHLPMEPKNYPLVKPGPGALFRSMNDHEISKVLADDLSQTKGARGVNNHMGSSFTEDREKMLFVLKELKQKGLFFVDSRTTDKTVAFEQAREIGVPTAKRRVFLDNNIDIKAMRIQMERLLRTARQEGTAIGICHPYKETLELLRQYQNVLKTDFLLVPVSRLVG